MVSYSKELSRIKELLEKNPQGMTITDISKALDVYRKTTAKYLDMLLITGQVEMRPFGPVKIYTPSRRVPVSSMIDLSRDYIIIFDRDLNIVEANDKVISAHGLVRDEIIGTSIGSCPLPYAKNERILEMLTDASRGKEFSEEIEETIVPGRASNDLKLFPTTFDDGSAGVTLMVLNNEGVKECQEDLRKRDVLLRTLYNLISYTPTDGSVEKYLERAMEKIGEGLNASRVYLSINGEDITGELYHERRAGWEAPGIEILQDGSEGERMFYSHSGNRLGETLSRGRVFFGNVRDLPDEERGHWGSLGIVSFALAPIFVAGEWWGFLGTDQWERSWEWTPGEMEGLRTCAGIIGSIIERNGLEDPAE